MIQDISPYTLDNSFRAGAVPKADDKVLIYSGGFLVSVNDGVLTIPEWSQIKDTSLKTRYLFSVSGRGYYLIEASDTAPDELITAEGLDFVPMPEIKNAPLAPAHDVFAVYTAYHLVVWYASNRFCGCCGRPTRDDEKERALVCTECGKKIYPRINPAVIIGITNGDSILITRYRRGFAHNALVAGFVEIGETLEQTVAREAMEETGLKVKNIRYYKSQPWGTAQDLLAGFYCEADGDTDIKMDNTELKYAEWVSREDIVLQPLDRSLTNEMMKMFKDGMV